MKYCLLVECIKVERKSKMFFTESDFYSSHDFQGKVCYLLIVVFDLK